MEFNLRKSQFVVYRPFVRGRPAPRQPGQAVRAADGQEEWQFTLSGAPLTGVTEYKYLGVELDDNLLMSTFIDRSRSRLAYGSYLTRLAGGAGCLSLSFSKAKMVWHAYALPHVLYGSECVIMPQVALQALDRLICKAAKGMLGLPPSAVNEAAAHEAGLLSAEAYVACRKLVFFHKLHQQASKLAADVRRGANVPPPHPSVSVFISRRDEARQGVRLSGNWVHHVRKLARKFNVPFDYDRCEIPAELKSKDKWVKAVLKAVQDKVTSDRLQLFGSEPRPVNSARSRIKESAWWVGELHKSWGASALPLSAELPYVVDGVGSVVDSRKSTKLLERLRCGGHFLYSQPLVSALRARSRGRDAPQLRDQAGAGGADGSRIEDCELCRLDPPQCETVHHFISACPALQGVRDRVAREVGGPPVVRDAVLAAIGRCQSDHVAFTKLVLSAGHGLLPRDSPPAVHLEVEVFARRLVLSLARERKDKLFATADQEGVDVAH